jgi:zinc transport system permease protein
VREFLDALTHHAFLQYAVLTGLLASVACGVVGTYVVTRRITYIAGGVAHSVLGGMGAALYFRAVHGWAWLHPLYGAVAAALAAAIVIGIFSLRARQREDTVIGAVWAVGMAVGILFLWKTPGYNPELMRYLFGNIIMVSAQDLWIVAGLDVLVVAASLAFFHPLQAVCFDEEFARLRGVRVEFYYLFLLALTALTVVLLTTVVGIVMVIMLLTLPVAVAGHFTQRLGKMMVLSSVFSALFAVSGLVISYELDVPPGATIILVAAGVYLAVILGFSVRRRIRLSAVRGRTGAAGADAG